MEVAIKPTSQQLFSAPASPSRPSDFEEFAFEFSEDLERTSLSADQLFHRGLIRTMEHPESPPNLSSSDSDSEAKKTLKNSNNKWKLRDFLLFRSASEGHVSEKYPMTKYYGGKRGISRRSAHELHYMAKKAVSQEMKNKTFLPYNQRILATLAFNGFWSLSSSLSRP